MSQNDDFPRDPYSSWDQPEQTSPGSSSPGSAYPSPQPQRQPSGAPSSWQQPEWMQPPSTPYPEPQGNVDDPYFNPSTTRWPQQQVEQYTPKPQYIPPSQLPQQQRKGSNQWWIILMVLAITLPLGLSHGRWFFWWLFLLPVLLPAFRGRNRR